MNAANSDLTTTRTIQAPRSALWAAWTDRDHFAKWWVPESIKCKVTKMDLRAGADFEAWISEAGAKNFTSLMHDYFLEVIPLEKIVFTTALTEG